MRASSAAKRDSTWDSEDTTVVIAERYAIESRLGYGASGSVYRVYDRVLERHVALKLLDPSALLEAEHEARTLAAIGHRNVVTIHDLGRDRGRRYLVLELLDGPSLSTWLRGQVHGPGTKGHVTEARDPATIVANFIEAGRGLEAAHEAGLVHRDFKPDNVILAERGRVVVVDFGLAEAVDRELDGARNGLTRGTLAYMAPEQLDGAPADARSDQFSFCVALWEALAGTNPFTGDDPLSRHRSIQSERPAAKAELPVSRHIVACLERGLSPNPNERFESMDALLAALESEPARTEERPSLAPLVLIVLTILAFLIGWGITAGG